MGGGESIQSSELKNEFVLDNVKTISLVKSLPIIYFWINDKQKTDILSELKKYIDVVTLNSMDSLATQLIDLKQYQAKETIKVIISLELTPSNYDFIKNQPMISEVFLFQQNKYTQCTKIKGNSKNISQLVKTLFQHNNSSKLPDSSILFFPNNIKQINLLRLGFQFLIGKHDKNRSKQDFIVLARQLFPNQQDQIKQFQKDYSIKLQNASLKEQTFQWVAKNNFYWKILDRLLKVTMDAKKIAYLRLPFYDLYHSIKSYNDADLVFNYAYVVINLSRSEAQTIKGAEKNFIIFTTFIKGTLDVNKAIAIKKTITQDLKKTRVQQQFLDENAVDCYMITIVGDRKIKNKLNGGFYISGTDIIFNVNNFFQIESITNTKISLAYGGLDKFNEILQDEQSRFDLNESASLVRNNYYFQQMHGNFHDQVNFLCQSGRTKQSLSLVENKINQLSQSMAQNKEQLLNKCLFQKGQVLLRDGEEKEALNTFAEVGGIYKQTALLRIAGIQAKKGIQQLKQAVDKMLPFLLGMKESPKKDNYFWAKNWNSVLIMKQGKYKQAIEEFNNLLKNVQSYYGYKLSGKAISHQIRMHIAACHSAIDQDEKAIQILDRTLAEQMDCEGYSVKSALTQSLYWTVCSKSQNATHKQNKSEQRLIRITNTFQPNQRKLYNRNLVAITSIGGSQKGETLIRNTAQINEIINLTNKSNQTTTMHYQNTSSKKTNPTKEYNIQQTNINIDI